MVASRLRAVEQAPKRARKGVVQAAADGDQLELLIALRARLAEAVADPTTPARDLAALSRRLLEVSRDIATIETERRGDEVGRAASTPDEEWSAI